ncbi:bifunctional DNA-formamidopyrimidine glycosylase/DNA-(apurinic or apyrimidinic site) lyase [Propionimicrobium sp. PCR01-08-3]|uniref:bifunctional DNA-formamidopyrimidine glycosylase/DNA-(apurinic or apyrimidinic site) lyase n=1 Tax=Propionimicrobium sp. PCR01-08-3 TaxID=3052086 RepID=UPI00255D066D|nr:bifunctional DNA-formamidopyrimidine glycosylase/DNA-(apurinic or apyrimidinic site) lyase [Propionimicrobium sp. PCR01-08-3]WIY81544.1 bifunctional DNA-formamidopyrimidine glycosylase/DNA-(apurinic or apyrimidinic site) lyase [Propionimicrobium sp. PCR01-08-3]
MPELPEVEVVRAGLAQTVAGRTISQVQVLHPRPVRYHPLGQDAFASDLAGRRVGIPKRRGKYLWLPLDGIDALLIHLGMSGQFRIDDMDAPLLPNTRVLFDFTDGGPQLRFVDQRMFGGLQLSPGGANLPQQIEHIALDPFDDAFEPAAVAGKMHARKTTVKRALLDQTLVSGIGNIYADESLWQARLHFNQPTETLTQRRAIELLAASTDVMAQALAAGGTSFDALYVHVNGNSGYFGRSLHVYGRAGQPCDRCGATIVREPFMNRSSYRCPRCQRRPRRVSQRTDSFQR